MGFSGEIKSFNFLLASFTHSRDKDNTADESLVHGSKNLYLGDGGLSKRGGTQHLNASAFTDTPEIMGLGYVMDYDGTQEVIAATADGKVYKDDTNTIKTGLTINKATNMTLAQEDVYICNGTDQPEVYAVGDANTHTIANPSTDWGAASRPKIMINHSLGADTRLVVPGVKDYPYTIYISKQGDLEEFRSASGGRTITVWTKHPKGLTGGISFGNRCMVFDRTNAYYIDDSNADDATWGYTNAQWTGGLAHERLVCATPNDVFCMMTDGTIYSVKTAESYGDYLIGNITEQQYMHEWIKEYIDMGGIADFHCCYDPEIKAVRYYMRRKTPVTSNQNDTCLVYYINRPVESRWFIEDNRDYASGYAASCNAIILDSTSDREKCYTGDYSGNIWTLSDDDKNDNDNGYYSGLKLRANHFGTPRNTKSFVRGVLVAETSGAASLTVRSYVDGVRMDDKTVTFTGSAQFGSAQFGSAQFGSRRLKPQYFEIRQKGTYLGVELFNSTADNEMRLSSLMVDYKILGSIPNY